MNHRGFEALADGTMLLLVLLVASALALALAARGPAPADDGTYVEDTRLALFRTTFDGLSFLQDGVEVPLPNGTSVEAFLRLQVHLVVRVGGALEFSAANDRIAEVATALVRPGWSFAIVGRILGESSSLRLPMGVVTPETYRASSWTYPSLDGVGPDTVLSLSMWLSPRR